MVSFGALRCRRAIWLAIFRARPEHAHPVLDRVLLVGDCVCLALHRVRLLFTEPLFLKLLTFVL